MANPHSFFGLECLVSVLTVAVKSFSKNAGTCSSMLKLPLKKNAIEQYDVETHLPFPYFELSRLL